MCSEEFSIEQKKEIGFTTMVTSLSGYGVDFFFFFIFQIDSLERYTRPLLRRGQTRRRRPA